MAIEFTTRATRRAPQAERERLLANPSFGNVFTDHMVTVRWTEEHGWHDARLGPYEPLAMDPGAQVFHYGQEIFEGLKAYRQADGSIVMFRPYANAERFRRSAGRMAMPALPDDDFVAALELLVSVDQGWVPSQPGRSLYLRPFMIATQASLGFYRPSDSYLFVVIASPAGAYFTAGVQTISVWVTTEYGRAAEGGTGAAKCGGNYGGTLKALQQAKENGFDQVAWLDPAERRWVDEFSTSNIFFVYQSRLVTPQLSGTVLAGITRDSLLTLAGDLGYVAQTGQVAVADMRADAASGMLTEVFSCGTSSMITPVGRVRDGDGEYLIGDGEPGPVTMRLRRELMGIQYGERPDSYGWVHKVA